LELFAAAFAVLSPLWLHALVGWLPTVVGVQTGGVDDGMALATTIGIAAVVLLPGTFCLGATLPALVEAHRRLHPDQPGGRGLGRLYAANTLGATAGVLITVHLFLPLGGMIGGAVALAVLGAVAATIAWRWGQAANIPTEPGEQVDAPIVDTSGDPDPEVTREPWLLLAVLAGTGLAGVGLEVVAVQVLSQILENTIFTFAHVLAVYLLGTAGGAALYTRYAARAVSGKPATVAAALLLAHGAAIVWVAGALYLAPGWLVSIAGTNATFGAEMIAESLVAAVVLGPVTLLMGALFSHVAGLLAPRGIGRAYAVNTLGGAVAPFVFGVWAIGTLGYRDALISVAYAYLAVFGLFTWFRRFTPVQQIVGILAIVGLTAAAPSSLLLVTRTPDWDEDWKVLDSQETVLGAVVVSEYQPEGERPKGPPLRRLQVGQEFRMGGALAFGERRMGHIPLLLHPSPTRALFLGVGTGSTLSAVTHFDSLTHVDAVELVPAVLDQLHHFTDINNEVADDARVQLHAADARRFVAATPDDYDVVVADLFHPGRDGAGNLYAREHFDNIRQRLTPGGVFAQWLPLYQLDPVTLQVVIRTFTDVFGEAHAWLGVYNVRTPAMVLIGRNTQRGDGPLEVDIETLATRLSAPHYGELLIDPRDLLGAYLLDRDGLEAFAGPGGLNTDLMPRVSVQAPRSAYEESSTRGRDNLLALLEARTALPSDLLTGADSSTVATLSSDVELTAEALGHYLRGESARLDTDGQVAGLVAATSDYLAAYEVAPWFRPARGMLIQATGAGTDLAERIFPVMLARTPDERIVWQTYLGYLQRTGDPRLSAAVEQARTRLGLPPAAQP
ncbi:MAG: fused MFS/spermidine synthase, partial [Deltaproteobacteria bacterium]|nr:fused MFS/spermidine synthase [Deltaproteobacteria bacterium]